MEPLIFPDWFRKVPGFTYADSDGDLCIYLGTAGSRDHHSMGVLNLDAAEGKHAKFSETMYRIEFRENCEIFTYLYKGEFHIGPYNKENLAGIQQLPENHDLSYVSRGEIPKHASAKLPEVPVDRSLWNKL